MTQKVAQGMKTQPEEVDEWGIKTLAPAAVDLSNQWGGAPLMTLQEASLTSRDLDANASWGL